MHEESAEAPATDALGICVPMLVRELLIARAGLPFSLARKIADELDRHLMKCGWLYLYNGTTYTRTFIPGSRK